MENLGFSVHWILTNVFATQADILTSQLSTAAYATALQTWERSPTTPQSEVRGFGS